MALAEELLKYKEKKDDHGVLSVYLNTDFGEGTQHNGEWKIRLKNGMKRLQEYVEKSGSDEELKAFKNISKKVHEHILSQQTDMQKGIVVFASADGGFWEETKVQVSLESEFHWEKSPVVEPLEKLESTYPPAGLLLIQQRDVILIDSAMGEIRDEVKYSWEFETEDWREYKGNASSDRLASGSTQVDEFQHRFEENRLRWYKQLGPIIDKQVKNRNLKGVYLIGNKEYVKDLEQHLNKEILDVIPKNLYSKPAHEILNEVYGESVR
ncbi:VLRF1 family aeRF1-type release factor [Thalassorhabdus alkalitolerans]|uniref:VLRF1 family aeRF1-type release factor n=2 Tax=Bacillaceae TaxID=186817 RepID=A0ABW0YLC1_9BACI